jgi:hypothetical protein
MEVPDDTGPITPLPPITPPPPTAEETIQVLGDADIMKVIAGTLTTRETARLAQTNQEIRQAVKTANQQRLQDIGDDPRVQQMALRVRSHLQKPVVRTGVFWDQTTPLAPPTSDVEVLIDRASGIADVSAHQRRQTLLDLRHATLSSDNPRATTQPNLVDRLGRPIERGRSFEGVPDAVQGPVDVRRPDHEQFQQGVEPPPVGQRPDRRRAYPRHRR